MSLHVLNKIDFLHWFDGIALLAWLKSAQRSRNVARLTPQLGRQIDLCNLRLLYIWLLFCYLEVGVKLQVDYILWAW